MLLFFKKFNGAPKDRDFRYAPASRGWKLEYGEEEIE